jgi:hypothetical protein
MTYLVDAIVLSEPTKARPDARVVSWLRTNETEFVVDSVILGELALGIFVLPSGRKRTRLERWLSAVVDVIDCLPWDAAVSRRWARLVADLQKQGNPLPVLDSMIAATALTHGLRLATRNVRDFQRAGVAAVDPFL